jgi:hypothetical protein
MKRGDRGSVQGTDKVEDEATIVTAPDSVFMLDGNDVHIAVTKRA